LFHAIQAETTQDFPTDVPFLIFSPSTRAKQNGQCCYSEEWANVSCAQVAPRCALGAWHNMLSAHFERPSRRTKQSFMAQRISRSLKSVRDAKFYFVSLTNGFWGNAFLFNEL